MGGNSETVDYQLREIAEAFEVEVRYHRFDIDLGEDRNEPRAVNDDFYDASPSNIYALFDKSDELLALHKEVLDELIDLFNGETKIDRVIFASHGAGVSRLVFQSGTMVRWSHARDLIHNLIKPWETIMSDTLLFISHKHSDSKIAQVLAAFIEERSNGTVKVHLSSSPNFQGPRFGKALNAELREALWRTEVFVLVYTSSDQDWSYCMWECGVASHPQSPNSTIIVFQCGPDVPAPFQDVLRVNVRIYDDIKRFTEQFLRDPELFPSRKGAIAPNMKDSYVENAAKQLHKNIGEVLPPIDDGLVEEWSAWPYLRIELPRSEADRIEQAPESERVELAHQIVKDYAVVADSDARAAQLFGRAGFPSRMKFETVLTIWKDRYPDADATWFDSCCEQVMVGARRGFPVIRWTPIREIGGDSDFTPVLSRIRRVPFGGSVQFDVYFYNLSDPRAMPVTSRMIPVGDFFYKNLSEVDPQSLKLKDIVEELDLQRLNRIPILNGQGHPLYIVHRSMIDKFIVKRVLSSMGDKNPNDLTLADLLADQEMKEIFENTFVIVKRQASLAETKSAMLTKPGCSDVFITAGGSRTEPVQGWLTNVDIARSS